jgi:hypothetical protein
MPDPYRPQQSRPAWLRLLAAALLLLFCAAGSSPTVLAAEGVPARLAASDASEAANRQFVQAMRLIRQADGSFDQQEENGLLREADRLLTEIEQHFPESTIAVQLITNQLKG